MTIICTGASLFYTTIYNPQATPHVGLAYGSWLGNQFCVTASVTIICTGISISSRSSGEAGRPLTGYDNIVLDDLEQLCVLITEACTSAGHWAGRHHPTSNLLDVRPWRVDVAFVRHRHGRSPPLLGQHRLAHLQYGHLYLSLKAYAIIRL